MEKVRSFHSSRNSMAGPSSLEVAIGSGPSLSHYHALTDSPIREESREVLTRATTLTTDSQQRLATVVDDDQPTGDDSHEPVKTDAEKAPAKPAVETSGAGSRGRQDSHANVATEFSREFEFVDDDEATGEMPMRSAWSLDAMKREKSRVDEVLAETLRTFAEDEREAATAAAKQAARELDQAARHQTEYALTVAIHSDGGGDTPSAIRAAAAITVSLLSRAIRDELRRLPASKCDPFQIRRAAVIVSRLMNEAASREVTGGTQPTWTDKAMNAAILLVEDIYSMAISSFEAKSSRKPDHVWTASAIRAASRIVSDVANEATQQASTSSLQRLSTQHQVPQMPVILAENPYGDQVDLEEQAIARSSSARLDTITKQPSSLAMQPSDIISVSSGDNKREATHEKSDSSFQPPAATRSTEAAASADNENVNVNNRAAVRGSSGGRLKKLFGFRRRDT